MVEAENGRSAVEILSDAAGPRLALLDWMMPEVSGLDVCREIRGHFEHPYVYIILLSAKTSKGNIVSGFAAGADDYLTKPCNPEELKARLRAGERVLKLEDKLSHDALHDPLTNLPNRQFFLDRLSSCVRRGMRHPDYKFAVLFVDMDDFTVVNNSLGDAAGDRLIAKIAELLVGCIRQEDTVSRSPFALDGAESADGEGVLARLGGDKFTILLDFIRDASDGIRVAERIQQNMRAPIVIDGQEVFTTASIGIAFSVTGYSAEDILGDAHTAMSRAKALGKARYEVCNPMMHAVAAKRFGLEADLRRAMERGEFRVDYQPIVSMGDCRIAGFEALLRWQRPEYGTVMPMEFISVAEDTGLILTIGKWVLREGCRQMCAWNLQFPCDPPRTVAVNISAREFDQNDLVAGIEEIVRESGLAPQYLKLELTESVTMRDEERAIRIFRDLQSLGVRLCIDDFGTGYSSLSYLRRFGLDVLKIDRSFVSEMTKNSEGREIVKALMSLGNGLRMEVIAEGVETAEQASLLKSLLCGYAQGNFYSKPLQQQEVAQALLGWGANAYSPPQQAMKRLVSAEAQR